MRSLILVVGMLAGLAAYAQETDTTEVEDYSQYADAELAGDAKRFATQKVLDQSPNN